jgi:hypothetical protein
VAWLFTAALLVYGVCPPFTSNDSYFVVPTALSLLRGSTAVDDAYTAAPEVARYAAENVGGHWRDKYPMAVPVLVTPIVGAIRLATSLTGPLASHAPHPIIAAFLSGDLIGGHAMVELLCAALIGALTVVVQYVILRQLAPQYATLLTLLFAFGSTQWSIASRNLMQHGLSVLLLSVAILLAIRPGRIGWAGLPLALAFTVRPSNWIAVVAFTLYVAIHQRRELLRFLGSAAPVAAVFFGYNLLVLGRLLPSYFTTLPSPYPFALGLAMNLVSPSRGVLVFMPTVLVAVAGAVVAIRKRWLFPLSPYLAAIPVVHWIFIAPYWPGHCFGPRYFADMTPFFCIFLVPAALFWGKQRLFRVTFGILALCSVFVNLRGGTSIAVNQWSALPVGVDQAQERVWDWHDPQFLRGLK